MPKPASVQTKHPDYTAMASEWQRCRDASNGERAVHAASTRYLPKLADEGNNDYSARLGRTPFFNATWRTIAGLRGMLFRKPAKFDAPASIKSYIMDIDAAGTPLQSFAQDVVENALTIGRVGVMVDFPQKKEEEVVIAQAEAMGLRPSLQLYTAETIINWGMQRIANASVLSLVVLTFNHALETDQFSHATEVRYRVLDLFEGAYRQRVFRIDSKGDDELVSEIFPFMNGSPMSFIPFVFVGVDDVGPGIDEPPLIDLISMNLHHYGVSADYEHGCHFQGLPTLFISGYQPEATTKIYIGGPTANCLPDPSAKAYFVETTGDFEALRKNLEDKKAAMAVLGARMLEQQKAQAETAETTSQHRKGEESLLSSMAQTVSMGLSQALTWFSMWAGGDAVEYELNRDFAPTGMSAQQLTALVAAWQAGAISQQVLFERLQAAEVIDSDTTFEDEQSRIGDAAPLMAAGAPVVR